MKYKTAYLRYYYNLQVFNEIFKEKIQITNIKNRKGDLPTTIYDSFSLVVGIFNLHGVH